MPYKDPEKAKAHRAAYKAAHREEIRIKDAAYRITNADKIRAAKKADALAHPEKGRIRSTRYRIAHPDKVKANQAIYIATHPEKVIRQNREKAARYRMNHPEKIHAYFLAHPEIHVAVEARRRAQKRRSPTNDFTAAQWKEIQAAYNHRCAYCGKRAKGHLTIDHITPLIKGGPHTTSNIVPACRECNAKKYTGLPLCQIQPLLLTIAKANGKQ